MQLAFWSAALAVGIAVGVLTGALAACVLAALACAALVVLAWLRAWNLGTAALALACGVGFGWRESARARAPACVEEDKMVEVVGQVVHGSDVAEAPAAPAGENGVEGGGKSTSAPKRSHLRIQVESADGKPVSTTLSLLLLDGVPDVAPGDWLRFGSRLYLPRGFANPGLPDGRLLARGQGIDLLATVRSPSELRQIPGRPCPLSHARRWAFRLRQAMGRAINNRLLEPVAGFVRTMVIGERTNVPPTVEDGFRAAGATHVLSVSGLHLAVVVALVFGCLKRFVACFPSWALRVSPKVAASALALPVCAFYTLLTGEAVATVRSAIMAAMVLAATIVNRPLSLAASIGAAAMVLLVESPAAILDVSFQLSFASVIGLGLFARFLLPHGPAPKARGWRRILPWLARSVSASLAACLVTMPIVAHHFGEITPAAPLGNLVLVPIVELVVLPFGLAGALLALVHPWLGALPLLAAGLASHLALGLAEVFRRLAPVLLVRFPDGCETLLLVAAAGCLLQALAGAVRSRRRWVAAAALAASLAATSLGVRDVIRRTRDDLRVTFLDIGQGDAALIEGPRGFTALVDGGGRYDDSFDTGARIVEPVLRAAGITRLDLVVLSHPHPDHMNGLLRILERFPVGALWTSGDDGHNPSYGKLLAVAQQRRVPTPMPAVLSRTGMIIEALGPWLEGTIGVPPGLGTNDASLVVRVTYAARRILFAGDIGDEGEAELLDRRAVGLELAADVLKMPHHGSRHASGARFLDWVLPSLAVVSVGRYNRFGLPSLAALERYARRSIEVLRTDRDGAVTVGVNALGDLTKACIRGCQPQ
jgi:competence protein ComEC